MISVSMGLAWMVSEVQFPFAPGQAELLGAALALPLAFPCCCIVPALLIGLAGTAFWIWMLVDCVQNEPSEGNDKIVWLLIILLLHFPGAVIYYFVRKNARGK